MLIKNKKHPKILPYCLFLSTSPELNPREQIWEKLREDPLANRCFKSEEELIQTYRDT